MNYQQKYLKYKTMYLELKNYKGGEKPLLALQSSDIRDTRLKKEKYSEDKKKFDQEIIKRRILEAQQIHQLQEKNKERKKIELRHNLSGELKEIIIKYNITNCDQLFNMRTINRKTKEHIDYNIDKIYNYFRVSNPYLLNLDNQFREIQLLDLSLNQKIKIKRQLVINSCREIQFEEERNNYLENEDLYSDELENLFAQLGRRIYYLYRILKKKYLYFKYDHEEIIDLYRNNYLEEYLNLIINLFKKEFPFIFYNRVNRTTLSLEELRDLDLYDMNQIEILNKLIIHIPKEKFELINIVGGINSFFMDILIENFTNEEYNRFINIFLRSDLHIYYSDTIKAVKEDFSELQIETIIMLQNNGFTDDYNAYAFNAVLNKFSERQIDTMLQFFKNGILGIKFNSESNELNFFYSLQQFAYDVAVKDLSKEKVNKIISIINTTEMEPERLGYRINYKNILNDALNSVI